MKVLVIHGAGLNMRGKVQLIISGGIRTGADVAKALAMGADAVSIGQGALFALGCNNETYFQNGAHHSAEAAYERIGTAPGFCHHCHTGRCPVGITTQDGILEQRLTPVVGAKHLKNYFKTMVIADNAIFDDDDLELLNSVVQEEDDGEE